MNMNDWHKSSYSGGNNDCVEVRETPSAADVRDTQNRGAGHLTFGSGEWAVFLNQVRSTEM